MTETSVSTHVLDKLKIDDYDPDNLAHQQVAQDFANKDFEALDKVVRQIYGN